MCVSFTDMGLIFRQMVAVSSSYLSYVELFSPIRKETRTLAVGGEGLVECVNGRDRSG